MRLLAAREAVKQPGPTGKYLEAHERAWILEDLEIAFGNAVATERLDREEKAKKAERAAPHGETGSRANEARAIANQNRQIERDELIAKQRIDAAQVRIRDNSRSPGEHQKDRDEKRAAEKSLQQEQVKPRTQEERTAARIQRERADDQKRLRDVLQRPREHEQERGR
jgi:hypothetical protein